MSCKGSGEITETHRSFWALAAYIYGMYQNFMNCHKNFTFDAFALSLASRSECVIENKFSYYSTKTYVVGTQKNLLDEAVLLFTQNKCWKLWIRK